MSPILLQVNAEWLRPGAMVVGTLTVRNEGISFRSLVPNPALGLDVAVELIERATASVATLGMANIVDVVVRGQPPLRFLVADPRACVLAIEQVVALSSRRGAYR